MKNDSFAAFQQASGTKFEVLSASGNVQLLLSKVIDHGSTPNHEQFSLLLLGPGNQFLPQRIYRLRQEAMGELALFLVPVGQEADGRYQYEIVFNRFIED